MEISRGKDIHFRMEFSKPLVDNTCVLSGKGEIIESKADYVILYSLKPLSMFHGNDKNFFQMPVLDFIQRNEN